MTYSPRLSFLLAVLVLTSALTGMARPAASQPEEPLKMTFVDATPEQSAKIYEKLRAIISQSDDIDFTNPDQFMSEARRFDLSLEVFASSGQRTGRQELIRRAMQANDLESVVVYKRTGDELHLIVLGPRGSELEHFRSPVRRPEISDKQAVAVLEKIFKVLVPEVRSFRKQQEDLAGDDQASARRPSGGAAESDSEIRERVIAEHKHAHGNLQQKATISLAPMFGRRALSISTDGGFTLAHSTPFVGGRAKIDAVLGLMNSDTAAFGGTVYGEYAPFSTQFGPSGNTFPGTYFRAGTRLRYLAGLSPKFILFGQMGGEILDLAIASNETYVGSRYISITAGVGGIYQIDEIGDITIEVDGLPTVMTDTNDGAFGSGAFSVGVNPSAQFTLRKLSPWVFSATYDFILYSPTHPNPTLYDTPASGADSVHVGGISAGYRF